MVPQTHVADRERGQSDDAPDGGTEDHEDVQHAYANFDIEESELQALAQAR